MDHAFSVVTQTTVIESVTEASVVRGGRSLFSNIMESSESFNVIRVDSGESIHTSSNTSGGAISASIEAMPSSNSRDDSDDIHHPPSSSEGISVSISHTLAPGSSGEISQLPLFTEADIMTMADTDYASIGNAPPVSVRDERLSESFVTKRSGRQFGITTPVPGASKILVTEVVVRAVPHTPVLHKDVLWSCQRRGFRPHPLMGDRSITTTCAFSMWSGGCVLTDVSDGDQQRIINGMGVNTKLDH